jgi:hypothetical protein
VTVVLMRDRIYAMDHLALNVGKRMTYCSNESRYSVIPANAGIHHDFGMSIFKWRVRGVAHQPYVIVISSWSTKPMLKRGDMIVDFMDFVNILTGPYTKSAGPIERES